MEEEAKPEITLEQSVVLGSLPVIFEGIYHGVEQGTIDAADLDNTLKLVLRSIKDAFL